MLKVKIREQLKWKSCLLSVLGVVLQWLVRKNFIYFIWTVHNGSRHHIYVPFGFCCDQIISFLAALKAYEENMKKIGSPLSYQTNATLVVKTAGQWLKDAPKRYLIDLKSSKQVDDTVESLPEDMHPVPPSDLDLDL